MPTIPEIKEKLKQLGIKGYSGKNKAELMAMLPKPTKKKRPTVAPEPVKRTRPKVAPEPVKRTRPKVAAEPIKEKTKQERIQDLMNQVPKDVVNMLTQFTGNPHQEMFTPGLKNMIEEAIGGNEDGYDDDSFHSSIFLRDTLEKIGKDTKEVKSSPEYGFWEYGGNGSGIGNMVDIIEQAYSNIRNPTFRLTIDDNSVDKDEGRKYYKILKELYKNSENSMTRYIDNNYDSFEDCMENIEDELLPSTISKYTLKITMPTEKARADAITFLRELREFISDKEDEKY